MKRGLLIFLKYILYIIGSIILSMMLLFFLFLYFIDNSTGKSLSYEKRLKFFNSHQNEFNELNNMILKYCNNGLYRIDNTRTNPSNLENIGLYSSDLKKIKYLFSKLNIERGISCDKDSIDYISYSYGYSIAGGSEGYYYSLNEPVNICGDKNLQKSPFVSYKDIPEDYTCGDNKKLYIKVDDGRYIFNEYQID